MSTAAADDVRRILERDLLGFRREVELFPDDVSLWAVVPGVSNSAGTLALHVAGNIRHFVGAVLGGSGYVRDREAEFSLRGLSRAEVMAELDRAVAEAGPALAALDDVTLHATYPAPLKGIEMPTARFLWALVVHTAYHLGQADYLRRIVTGDARAGDNVGPGALV